MGEGAAAAACREHAKRTPPFWCNCSVGYQKESFAALFGREVKATLKETKLTGSDPGVFVVEVGPSAT